jgi:quercetin dioxygenase-like cupin family protein
MTDLTAPDPGRRATIRAAGDAPATWALGSLFERLVTAGHTGGLLDAAIVTQPPGAAPPEHVHAREAEAWYVLDGSLIYRAGEQETSLTAGDFIYLPAAEITRWLELAPAYGIQVTGPPIPDPDAA